LEFPATYVTVQDTQPTLGLIFLSEFKQNWLSSAEFTIKLRSTKFSWKRAHCEPSCYILKQAGRRAVRRIWRS